MGEEGSELLGVNVSFPASAEQDEVIARFGDQAMIAEMQKVFFSEGPNAIGHSYARLMRGPGGRSDFEDIASVLRKDNASKRAVVTLCAEANGKVPCINVIQFLIREDKLQLSYYSRGQDAFAKFYADGRCLCSMAQKVAGKLNVPAGMVTGFLASSHVYHRDAPAIEALLTKGREHLQDSGQGGVT